MMRMMTAAVAASMLVAVAARADTPEPAASRLWEVQLMKNGKGQMWCEAHMTGQNPQGGGRYRVRLFVNGNEGEIDVFHDGPKIDATEATFTMDGKFKVMTRPIKQLQEGNKGIIMTTLNFENFTQKFIPNLEHGRSMEIHVGPRTYFTVVDGFKAVSDKMGHCQETKDHVKGKS